MHVLLCGNLEGYLSGALPPAEQQKIDAHLADCAPCKQELEAFRESAGWLRELRQPSDPGEAENWEPRPGFYARVIDRIEREREVPFWAMLLEPAFGRRIVFACLLLLAVLGAYVATLDPGDYPSRHRPESILAGQPSPVHTPRLGTNLDHNRGVVLATLVASQD